MDMQNCFPVQAQIAFDYLMNVGGLNINGITTEEDETKIIFTYSFGTNITLRLMNSCGAPIGDYDGYFFESDSLEKHGDKYTLSGEVLTYDSESDNEVYEKFVITFTDAKAEISLYNATEQLFQNKPWDYLHLVAYAIAQRAELSESILNEREKALLPLVKEINLLSQFYLPYNEIQTPDFSNLKSYAQKYDYSELVTLIDKLENNFIGKERDKYVNRLINALNMQKYEPLWREIYRLIVDSQSDYPSEFADSCPAEMMTDIRSEIELELHKYGYAGTYPDFIKTGSQNGIHMVQSYDVDYIVGFEKNVAHHIHCNEFYGLTGLKIEFLCGFERIRKGEPSDIYSCAFNCKGKKIFQSFFADIDINSDSGEQRQKIDKCTQIAIKKAELKKLTKDERIAANIYIHSDLCVFLAAFFIMGGLFGFFMTLGFMLIEVVFTAIVGQANQIPELFISTPWWVIFLLAWVLFGGAMGVVQVIGKRK